jgi:hypothetical protein
MIGISRQHGDRVNQIAHSSAAFAHDFGAVWFLLWICGHATCACPSIA